MVSFGEVILQQSTVGTMMSWNDIGVMLFVVSFILLLMYLGERMNAKRIFQQGDDEQHIAARLMHK